MQSTTRSIPHRIADGLLIALFLSGISLPALTMLRSSGDRNIAETERRLAAPFPELAVRRIGPIPWIKKTSLIQFPPKFEKWYDDHVGFRRPLIRLYNVAKYFGLTTETGHTFRESAQNPVIVGSDGWLFFGSAGKRDFRRIDPFPPESLKVWRNYLTKRRDWFAARKIGHAFFIAPNKQTIYPEYMPRAMTRADRPSRFDQLLAEVSQEPSLHLLDLRKALTDGRDLYPTYHHTDTHWNEYGAYLGYRFLMSHLNRHMPAAPALPLESFDIEAKRVVSRRDLVRMMNAAIDIEDTLVTLTPRTPRCATWEMGVPSDDFGSFRKSTNYNVPSGRLVVFHDSFIKALRPFLSENFREVYYFWQYTHGYEHIETIRPDFVLDEMVERHLLNDLPKNPPYVDAPVSDSPASPNSVQACETGEIHR
ncbi:MAG: hypothetical protein K8U03_10825 [Planctomycetia bacterium]|nr:hypothetical protein [Planctomycetia bacterium]